MHDPMTLIWSMKWPKWLIRAASILGIQLKTYTSLLDIWHIDPETDGTDNSCDWFGGRKLSDSDKKIVESLVQDDQSDHYLRSQSVLDSGVVMNPKYQYKRMPAGLMYPLVFGVWRTIAWRRDRRESVSPKELAHILDLASNPVDNLQSLLVNNDGYLKDDDERVREFIRVVMGNYIRFHRPWYRHPRWHIHHWEINIPFMQNLKRWLFPTEDSPAKSTEEVDDERIRRI